MDADASLLACFIIVFSLSCIDVVVLLRRLESMEGIALFSTIMVSLIAVFRSPCSSDVNASHEVDNLRLFSSVFIMVLVIDSSVSDRENASSESGVTAAVPATSELLVVSQNILSLLGQNDDVCEGIYETAKQSVVMT